MNNSSTDNGKKGILLVAFGTSVKNAHTAYNNIEQRVQAAFSGIEIRWGFTSTHVRNKLKSMGSEAHSPISALACMAEEGFKHVAVQSLHVIPGMEYHDLLRITHSMKGLPKGIESIKTGGPLLETHEDYLHLSEIINQHSDTFLKTGEALVLMGHGTPHSANICYPGLQYYFKITKSPVFVGTIEGFPTIEDVIPQIKADKYKTIWLMPLLVSAGDHVLKDMAGENSDSWKSKLKKEGFDVNIHSTSLGMINDIVDLWIEKIRKIIE